MQPDINPPLPELIPESTQTSLLRKARRWITIVIGMSVLGFGLAAILLPVVPAFVIVPIGLAILATELVWAKHLLHKIKEKVGIKDKMEESPPNKLM